MKNVLKSLSLVIIVVIFIYLIFFFPYQKRAPFGTPTDFYENIEEVNEYNVLIYILDDYNFLPNELAHISVGTIDDLPMINSTQKRYLIIDFKATSLSETDVSRIEILYNDFEYKIILLNYASQNMKILNDFLDEGDDEYDFIVLENFNDIQFSAVVITNIESTIEQKQYDVVNYIKESQ